MENLTPPVLQMARELHWRISTGQSMRESMRSVLSQDTSTFACRVRDWWTIHLQTKSSDPRSHFSSPYQQALIEVILRGSQGQPINETLTTLIADIERAAEDELATHIATLPFKVLLPLLLLMFPAFLILLLGPLLRDLQSQLGG